MKRSFHVYRRRGCEWNAHTEISKIMTLLNIYSDINLDERVKPQGIAPSWRPSVYALIENERHEVLVNVPTWSTTKRFELPGGGVELDESITEAIKRECLEETGYQIELISTDVWDFLERNFYANERDAYYRGLLLTFRCRTVGEQDPSVVESTIEKIAWMSLTDLTQENTHPAHWPAINKLKILMNVGSS